MNLMPGIPLLTRITLTSTSLDSNPSFRHSQSLHRTHAQSWCQRRVTQSTRTMTRRQNAASMLTPLVVEPHSMPIWDLIWIKAITIPTRISTQQSSLRRCQVRFQMNSRGKWPWAICNKKKNQLSYHRGKRAVTSIVLLKKSRRQRRKIFNLMSQL